MGTVNLLLVTSQVAKKNQKIKLVKTIGVKINHG